MKRLATIAMLVGTFLICIVSPASAYLYVSGAEDKGRANSWANLCLSTYNVCTTYPYIYRTAVRIDSNSVNVFVRVRHRSHGLCDRKIRVNKQASGNIIVIDSQSSLWGCF